MCLARSKNRANDNTAVHCDIGRFIITSILWLANLTLLWTRSKQGKEEKKIGSLRIGAAS